MYSKFLISISYVYKILFYFFNIHVCSLNSLFVNFLTVLKVAYFYCCSGIQAVFCYHNYGGIRYSGLNLESDSYTLKYNKI